MLHEVKSLRTVVSNVHALGENAPSCLSHICLGYHTLKIHRRQVSVSETPVQRKPPFTMLLIFCLERWVLNFFSIHLYYIEVGHCVLVCVCIRGYIPRPDWRKYYHTQMNNAYFRVWEWTVLMYCTGMLYRLCSNRMLEQVVNYWIINCLLLIKISLWFFTGAGLIYK